jgi:hypothetical protein
MLTWFALSNYCALFKIIIFRKTHETHFRFFLLFSTLVREIRRIKLEEYALSLAKDISSNSHNEG